MAPAAVYLVGVTFTLRDIVHEQLGRSAVALLIVAGAALSAFISPSFAVASGVAFLLSEFADLAVYGPLRAKHLVWAVVASNAVGLVVDSVIFLQLAFGSTEFLPGQIVGKSLMTLAALPVIAMWGNRQKAAA